MKYDKERIFLDCRNILSFFVNKMKLSQYFIKKYVDFAYSEFLEKILRYKKMYDII